MKNDSDGAIRERMLGAGKMLLQLGKQPEAVRQFRAAIDAEDLEGFQAAFERGLGGFDVPPDRCDPYIRVVVAIVRPPRFVRRCVWVYQSLAPIQGKQLAEVLAPGVAADRLIEVLESLGLVVCTWERENQDDVIIADKFVQGMCPPGTF